ncbi:arsenate reductase (azurin) small subunit [Aestuariirhabdus litorea]|uniref:Arsenate reductase (Azurin) small subunit n=1 Tax=Aestuariirhabdus litorea TaxID=2528527 RepID=A0A3P3VQG8_9GAMM|nr:arsenate reductase (azurin) small subunit [Aestuariirhabdus litorea]RRJ85032.1 arsenate reductase (azurin) small subunit [Aestuariirhabdus litorea]RWW98258.1 arsenate reductase (azurin) small subunit [Endozoicomonadaceae bacterium GTF-13]
MSKENSKSGAGACLLSRRNFLLGSTVAATTISVTLFPGSSQASPMKAHVVGYPRKKIATLKELKANQPIAFSYPEEGILNNCILVQLGGVEAGGGIGPQRDIVAFSSSCTHQGGPLESAYKAVGEHRVLGQCPFHLSTFDLRRHGIVISGQAYQSLPQVLLEVEGPDIFAVGMMGLLFGHDRNLREA